MRFKLNFFWNNAITCFSTVFLPCFADIPRNGIRFSLFKGKIESEVFHKASRITKLHALFVFFLAISFLGSFVTFGQKTVVPDVNASVSGAITCTNTSVILRGSSKTPGVYYVWTGPHGYQSNDQNPVTAIPGEYTVKVRNSVNNSIVTASVKVMVDTIPPADIKTSVSGLLTCIDTLATLSISSSTSGVAYRWRGPKGFTSGTKNVVTSVPGIYTVKVINPANGCVARTDVRVDQNIKPPSGVSATASGVLTCTAINVKLRGGSATQGVSYHWSGKDFKSSLDVPVVSTPGTYELTVTDPANGCSSETRVTVKQNVTVPAMVTAEAMDSLTCKNNKVTLKASSATTKAGYSWSGPLAFTSRESTTETGVAGVFTVAVTNPENGCSVKKEVVVVKDTISPEGLNVTPSGTLTCNAKTVVLNVSSSLPKMTYAWNGPANFKSTQAAPSVSMPGKYEVMITNAANGCSSTKSVKVDQNVAIPEGVSASVSGSLSCKTPQVKLEGSSATKEVNYSWSGPSDFKSTEKSPTTKIPGIYILSAFNQQNGCISKADVTVTGVACIENK